MRKPLLLILGASARAAAFSAASAGFAPNAADLFADADLCSLCRAVCVNDYPWGLETAAASFPKSPWMYTGALENRPNLVDRIAAARPLWGNSAEVLQTVRDPWRVAQVLNRQDLLTPDLHGAEQGLRNGEWLVKPRRSASGAGVRRFTGNVNYQSEYLQRFTPGDSHSGVYIGATGMTTFIGATKQLVGAAWAGATGFRYAGSIGPVNLSPERRLQFQQIGDCLAQQFSLRGLFGVDVIECDDRLWTIEVNPRYTASVEILERGLSWHSIADHAAACTTGVVPKPQLQSPQVIHGKAVLYASHPIVADSSFVSRVIQENADQPWPQVADIPHVGTTVHAGHPMMTIFGQGATTDDVELALQKRASQWRPS